MSNAAVVFSATGTIQTFDVTTAGTYVIEASGAQGGGAPGPGVKGSRVSGMFYLKRGDSLKIVAGTRGAHHRQLWVMALDPDAPAGTDPSFAPFWLPGQARDSENMAARWAPAACRPTGEDCTVSSQCCSGSMAGRWSSPPARAMTG